MHTKLRAITTSVARREAPDVGVTGPDTGWRIRCVRARAGFSLIEVSLALLLIGTSMIALLALFPKGVAQGDVALNDTQAAMFSRYVFSSMRAQAENLTWAEWSDDALLQDALLKVDLPGGMTLAQTGTIAFPDVSGKRKLYYKVSMARVDDRQARTTIRELVGVTLAVSPAADSSYSWSFYTEMCYAALPQG